MEPLPSRSKLLFVLVALAFFGLFTAHTLRAATDYWNTAVNGTWSNTTDWSLNAYPNSTGTNAYFSTGSTTAYTVTLDGNYTVDAFNATGDGVTIDMAGYDLSLGASLEIAGSTATGVPNSVTFDGGTTAGAAGTSTISNVSSVTVGLLVGYNGTSNETVTFQNGVNLIVSNGITVGGTTSTAAISGDVLNILSGSTASLENTSGTNYGSAFVVGGSGTTYASSSNSATVNDATVDTSELVVGSSTAGGLGNGNSLTISNGGSVVVGTPGTKSGPADFSLGTAASGNSIVVTGTGSNLTINGALTLV